MGDDTRERLRAILDRDLDWPLLTERAIQHRVLSLVYSNVSATYPDAVPPPIREQHRKHFQMVAARNRALSNELCRLVEVLAANDLPCIPFKGPTLAITAYQDLSLRQFGDLDILVRREHVFDVQEALKRQGYVLQDGTSGMASEAARQSSYYIFVRSEGSRRFRVDLQWCLVGGSFRFPLDTECSWDHWSPEPLNGATLRSLSTEDLLLVLCIHGAKHHWERLSWICDVAEMVRAHGNLNWDQLLANAERRGMRRALAVGLALAKEMLDAPVPAPIWRRVQSDRQVSRLIAPIRAHFGRLESAPTSAHTRLEFHVKLRERWQDRVGYALHIARHANQPERWRLPLTAALSCGYYLARPVWLVGKHATRRMGLGRHRNSAA
jgi:hypothetical protein